MVRVKPESISLFPPVSPFFPLHLAGKGRDSFASRRMTIIHFPWFFPWLTYDARQIEAAATRCCGVILGKSGQLISGTRGTSSDMPLRFGHRIGWGRFQNIFRGNLFGRWLLLFYYRFPLGIFFSGQADRPGDKQDKYCHCSDSRFHGEPPTVKLPAF